MAVSGSFRFKKVVQGSFMKQCSISRPLILAVDDNIDNLWLLSMSLELFGLSHICIDQGKYAVEAAKRYHPELILLDIVMSDLAGIAVANSLRAEPMTSDIPIIGMTAMVTWEYPECLPIHIFDKFLTKPYMLDDLEGIITGCLSKTNSCLAIPA